MGRLFQTAHTLRCQDVTTLLGTALAQYVDLNESIIGQSAGVESQTRKLDLLKSKLAGERLKLAKLKDAAKRRRELAKANQHNAPARSPANESKSTQSRVALLNGNGRWIGWVETMANKNVNIYDAKGKIVGRELAGLTIDRTGRLVGKGRLGLVALGQSLRR